MKILNAIRWLFNTEEKHIENHHRTLAYHHVRSGRFSPYGYEVTSIGPLREWHNGKATIIHAERSVKD